MIASSTSSASVKSPDVTEKSSKLPNLKEVLRLKGRGMPGLVFLIGYLLSPLSWWNDAFVNLPLAYFLGLGLNLFWPGSFNVAMIVAYWLSNLAGILFMYWGGSRLLGKEPPKKREIWNSIVVSLLYTVGLYLLMHWGIVKPFKF